MKPFKKCMAVALIATLTTMGAATVASASEDIPGTYYSDPAAEDQGASDTRQPAAQSPGYSAKSIQDYEDDNKAIGIPKSRVEQSPSMRYDGAVVGDTAEGQQIDLSNVEGDDDAMMTNATADSRIADSQDNTRQGTESAQATASDNNVTVEGEEGKESATTTSENTQTAETTENPTTGRAGSVVPVAAAAMLSAAAIPFAARKRK